MSNEKLDQASALLREWYYTGIRSIVDCVIELSTGKLACVNPDDESVARDAELQGDQDSADRVRATRPTHRVKRERGAGVDAREFIGEHVDGITDDHEFVIYTYKAKCVLLASDNEDAYDDEFGTRTGRAHGETDGVTVECRACYAMRADVWQLLNARSDEWDVEDDDGETDESRARALAICGVK